MARRRMRRGERPREPEALVLRAGDLVEEQLRRDAESNREVYGFYGLSVWIPGEDVSLDDLLAGKLKRASGLKQFVAGELYSRGLELWDTGMYPHYGGVHQPGESLDGLVSAICSAPFTLLVNPYFDPDGGEAR